VRSNATTYSTTNGAKVVKLLRGDAMEGTARSIAMQSNLKGISGEHQNVRKIQTP